MPQTKILNRAIDLATDWLRREQRPDGGWDGKISSETIITAWVSYGMWLWKQTEAQKGFDWLTKNQNPDGGWGGECGLPSYLDATYIAMTVLRASSSAMDEGRTIYRAEKYLDSHPGDIHRLGKLLNACVTGDFSQVAAGPVRALKVIANLAVLLPKLARRLLGYMHESMYVIALGLTHQKKSMLDQIVNRRATRSLEALWDAQGGRWVAPGLVLIGLAKFCDNVVEKDILNKAFNWVRESQNADGGWGWCPHGQFITTPLAVLALLDAELSPQSTPIKNATAWIKQQWAVEGAWGAHSAAPPDADDTACALLALLRAGEPQNSFYIQGAVTFLKKDQLANGSWGYPNPTNHGEVTAIAIEALLEAGILSNTPIITKGVKWLFNHQLPDGSWPLRWYVQEMIASFRAVSALQMAGYPKDGGVTQFASHYILSRRQPDGSFGSLEDTAYAILALLNLEQATHPAIEPAINELIQAQNPDGGWSAAYNGFFADTDGGWISLYRDRLFCHAHCLWALGKYRKLLSTQIIYQKNREEVIDNAYSPHT